MKAIGIDPELEQSVGVTAQLTQQRQSLCPNEWYEYDKLRRKFNRDVETNESADSRPMELAWQRLLNAVWIKLAGMRLNVWDKRKIEHELGPNKWTKHAQ